MAKLRVHLGFIDEESPKTVSRIQSCPSLVEQTDYFQWQGKIQVGWAETWPFGASSPKVLHQTDSNDPSGM